MLQHLYNARVIIQDTSTITTPTQNPSLIGHHSTSTLTTMTSLTTNPTDRQFYTFCVIFLNLISLPTYLSCRFIQAPYGRHSRTGWGPTIPSWISWFLMESPTVFLTLLIYFHGVHALSPRSFTLISFYLFHYIHRTIVYPFFRLRTAPTNSQFPVSVALMAFAFNLLNAYVQARGVSEYGGYGEESGAVFWGRLVVGAIVFGVGIRVNIQSDKQLVGLKKEGKGYRIPRGGWFEKVSCANYLGEIVEWFGWSLMTWSWAAFGFFLYTCANLVPRACANHRWYLTKFGEDYPKDRRVVIPFLY